MERPQPEDIPLVPKVYLTGWAAILDAVGETNDRQRRDRIKQWHEKFGGPIIMPGRGGQPTVVKAELLAWWDRLALRLQELSNRSEGKRQTAAEQYQRGKRATVNPGIGGHTKKRKRPKK
jgi:hypothetical protein